MIMIIIAFFDCKGTLFLMNDQAFLQLFDKIERNKWCFYDKTERNNGLFLTKSRGIPMLPLAPLQHKNSPLRHHDVAGLMPIGLSFTNCFIVSFVRSSSSAGG